MTLRKVTYIHCSDHTLTGSERYLDEDDGHLYADPSGLLLRATGFRRCAEDKWNALGFGTVRAVDEPAVPAVSAAKPSNPKDACGIKKAPLSTVSAAVLAEVGVAMLEGASKYGRHNYRAVGVRASVYYDATIRHLFDWWEGTDTDPDSGMHHVTKAITSLVVLRDAMIQGKLTDDRPPRSAEFYKELNALAEQIIERHADKNPTHYTISGASK